MVSGSPSSRAPRADEPPGPPRGPFGRWPQAADAAIAAVVFVIEVVSLSVRDRDGVVGIDLRLLGDLPLPGYALLGAGSVALLWRRELPISVLAANLIASTLWAVLGYEGGPLLAGLIALYGVGRYVPAIRLSLPAVGMALAVAAIGDVADHESAAAVGASLALTFLPWYLGRRIRSRREYLAMLEERATYLGRERAAETARALGEERTRIARELHDVVAHRVSVMTIQAGAAKTVAADDPEGAYRAMEAVEQAGRQALGELRHLLGVLRPGPGEHGLAPQPGLADVPRLVAQLRQTGMDVSLALDEVPPDLPARLDLSAYRIVQEALTNVLKHAGPGARSEVRLSVQGGTLIVEVADRGSGGPLLPGSGQGIIGMRERAQLLGGTLEAGPQAGGGFRVVASLPLREERT